MKETFAEKTRLPDKVFFGEKKEGGLQAESKVAKTGKREKRNGEGGFCLRYGSGRYELIIYSDSYYLCSTMYVHFRQKNIAPE